MNALSTTSSCKKLGVHPNTLRNWANAGKIEYYRNKSSQRYYYVDKYLQTKNNIKTIILYSRVSSYKQRDDLERQKKYLRNNIPNQFTGYKIIEISDVASGINNKRKGLLQILGLVKETTISTIIVASKDRLSRFGIELIEWICKQYYTEILVLNRDNKTPESELSSDLMSIVQIYCCRWNGQRRYSKKIKNNKELQIEITTK